MKKLEKFTGLFNDTSTVQLIVDLSDKQKLVPEIITLIDYASWLEQDLKKMRENQLPEPINELVYFDKNDVVSRVNKIIQNQNELINYLKAIKSDR